ncbi:hypothetical protein PoMZ_06297, partial [Pyricularia oryzae]
VGAVHDAILEPKFPCHFLEVRADLTTRGEPPAWHVVHLLEERHVDTRLNVAVQARVAVPVPRASDAARPVHQLDITGAEAFLGEPHGAENSTHAGPQDQEFDIVSIPQGRGCCIECGVVCPRVFSQRADSGVGAAVQLLKLGVSVRAYSFGGLLGVLGHLLL